MQIVRSHNLLAISKQELIWCLYFTMKSIRLGMWFSILYYAYSVFLKLFFSNSKKTATKVTTEGGCRRGLLGQKGFTSGLNDELCKNHRAIIKTEKDFSYRPRTSWSVQFGADWTCQKYLHCLGLVETKCPRRWTWKWIRRMPSVLRNERFIVIFLLG